MNPLLPARYTNRDFFACDLFDGLPYFKDDIASMEHPVFSLSTKPDMRVLEYQNNGNTIAITPSWYGLPTIHDKDILLYCASYLRAGMAEGLTPNQRIRFTAYDFLISTNRGIDGRNYENFKKGLDRLRGTSINTNIKTGGYTIESGFGIIDGWHVVKEDENGRVIAVEIKVSDWFYNAIISNELLTINREYFRLRKPLDRRIYEIVRKHCGDQPEFKIGLDKLHKKIGSTAPLKKLRFQLNKLIKTNHLPDYSLSMADDLITVKNRRAAKPENLSFGFFAPETYEKAKRAAGRLDVYYLEGEFRDWMAGKAPPKKGYEAAFIGFCKTKAKQAAG
jgi:plasmid replication initiation protein